MLLLAQFDQRRSVESPYLPAKSSRQTVWGRWSGRRASRPVAIGAGNLQCPGSLVEKRYLLWEAFYATKDCLESIRSSGNRYGGALSDEHMDPVACCAPTNGNRFRLECRRETAFRLSSIGFHRTLPSHGRGDVPMGPGQRPGFAAGGVAAGTIENA